MVAELFGLMCFEIKGKINPTRLLGLLQNLIKSHQPFCWDIYHLGNHRGGDDFAFNNKIFLRGVYKVNTNCPRYH